MMAVSSSGHGNDSGGSGTAKIPAEALAEQKRRVPASEPDAHVRDLLFQISSFFSGHSSSIEEGDRLRRRFLWVVPVVLGFYALCFLLSLIFFLFFPLTVGEHMVLPLVVLLTGFNVVVLSVLVSVLGGVYRRQGGEASLSDWSRLLSAIPKVRRGVSGD